MKNKLNTLKKWLIKNIYWIVIFICTIGFLALAEDVWNNEIMKGDIIGYNLVSKYLICDTLTPMAKIITNFANYIFLIIVDLILVILIKNKKIGASISINLILITILNMILKDILKRPRPTEYQLISETGYSFPSGHSMVSMAFYGFLIFLIYKYVENKKLKIFLITILSILIILIGISRIYLGVHYTSDVLGGFLISISYIIIYSKYVNTFILTKSK